MSADAVSLLELGRKFPADLSDRPYIGQPTNFAGRGRIGATAMFQDNDRDPNQRSVQIQLSGMNVEARLVVSDSAAAMAPGSAVKFTAPGTNVEQAGAADIVHGVVDPFLDADVEQNDVFWVIIEGPGKVVSSAAIAVNDSVVAAASGQAVTAAASAELTYAKAIEAAAGAGELIRAYISCRRVI